MTNKTIRKLLLCTLVLLSLPLFLLLTNPEKLPLPVLIMPIVLVFFICYIFASLILGLVRSTMPTKKRHIIAGVASILPTLLVVLQSIQQLSMKDVLIVLGLWLLFVWYLQRVDFI